VRRERLSIQTHLGKNWRRLFTLFLRPVRRQGNFVGAGLPRRVHDLHQRVVVGLLVRLNDDSFIRVFCVQAFDVSANGTRIDNASSSGRN
jgi:hypothetical protein